MGDVERRRGDRPLADVALDVGGVGRQELAKDEPVGL
jgi:hypothetical protein